MGVGARARRDLFNDVSDLEASPRDRKALGEKGGEGYENGILLTSGNKPEIWKSVALVGLQTASRDWGNFGGGKGRKEAQEP